MQRIKYPRTPHLPWSPGRTSDDLVGTSTIQFEGRDIVITEKMDGENTTLYRDHMHARSLDSGYHPSRDWIKGFHAQFAHDIPVGWRICGENLYAQHALRYENLPSYFLAFSIWNDRNLCLSWAASQSWFEKLKLSTPKVLYRGPWDERTVRDLEQDTGRSEGYVVRLAGEFEYDEFSESVAKWVRKSHVESDVHWSKAKVIPNGLAQ